MKTSFVVLLGVILIIAYYQTPVEKQYFTESSDIDLSKKLMDAYLAGDWDAYPGLYTDTARIWRNKNWTKDEGFTVQQYIDDLKSTLEPVSSYKFENQTWLSIINDDGDHWVHFWGVWVGHNELNNKDYEIPVHVATLIVDNKIVGQGEFFNEAEVALDMSALAQEKEAEVTDQE